MPVLALIPVGIWVSLAITVATTALQYGLAAMKKKPKPATFTFDDETQSVYDPLAPWKVLNGEGRTGGAVVYKRTNAAKTQMWMVVAIGPGPITAMPAIALGDVPIIMTGAADGSVQGKYATKLFAWVHLGDADQTVDTNLRDAFPDEWTDNHRLRGLAYVVLKFLSDAALYGRGIPNPSVYYKGLPHTDPRTGTIAFTSNPVICIRSWLMNTVWGRRVPAARIDDASIAEEADHCDVLVPSKGRTILAAHMHSREFTASAANDTLTFTFGFYGDDAEGGLHLGDPVEVSNVGGGLPAGLSASTTYYAVPSTNTAGGFVTKLATSLANALAGTAIDITTAGTGSHLLHPKSYRLTLFGNRVKINVASAANDDVSFFSTQTDQNSVRDWRTGTKCRLFAETGALPTGTNDDTDYYVFNSFYPRRLKLATSAALAEAGTAVNITADASGNSFITFLGHGGTVTANATTDLLTVLEDKGFATGDRVMLETTTTLPAPLEAGRAYFWIRVSATTGRVADTLWKALRGRYINLTDTGSGTHSIHADRYEPDLMQSIATGDVVKLITTESASETTDTFNVTDTALDEFSTGASFRTDGQACTVSASVSLPTGLTAGVVYYIRDSIAGLDNRFALYLTLADALADTNRVDITDSGSGTLTIRVFNQLPPDLSLDTEYYAINRGRGLIDLAATRADAFANNPIIISGPFAPEDEASFHKLQHVKAPRFSLNGSFDTDTTYGEVLQAMLTSIGGYADPSGGEWRILPARYRVPEITLGKDDVHGGAIELTPLLPAHKTANTLTGVYTDPKNLDQPSNFPTLIDADAVAEDGGQTIQDEIVLPFTNTETMAVRLAMIDLNRRRRQKGMMFPTDLAGGWPVAVADGVIIDLPGIGGDGGSQIYECTRWALSTSQAEDGGPPVPLVNLSLRENDPFIYRD